MEAETDCHGTLISDAVAAAFDARLPRALADWENRMTDVLNGLTINGQIASATTFTGKKRIR
ncbi:MAG: hypothetical protein V4701_07420, partial [Pseudomonadota bacterium]